MLNRTLLALALLAGGADAARAASYQHIYDFKGADGYHPAGTKLAVDPSGALYGCNQGNDLLGQHATLWKLQPSGRIVQWKLTVLQDYGPPQGVPFCHSLLRDGGGTLFVMSGINVTALVPGSPPVWQGVIPTAPNEDSLNDIVLDSQGQVVAADGGGDLLVRAVQLPGGTWSAGTLYQFGVKDSAIRPNILTAGSDGTIYGATSSGGPVGGYLFQEAPRIGVKFLASVPILFGHPVGVTPDGSGNLYGATDTDAGYPGVFRWRAGYPVTMLHYFSDASGKTAQSPPVVGGDGALYGTTRDGGPGGCGVVYRLTPAAQYTVVHAFACGADGGHPETPVVQGPDGYLYGTASVGGANGQGLVFRVHP